MLWLALLLFLGGTATSIVIPVLALFAADGLGASKLEVTIYFAATAAAGMTVVLVIGRLSDFVASRKTIVVGSFGVLALGYMLLALSDSYAQMILIGVAFLSWPTVAVSQLFAAAKEHLDERDMQRSAFVTGLLRMFYSLGWAVGPAIGGWLIARADAPTVFRVAAGVYLVAIAVAFAGLPAQRGPQRSSDQLASLRRLAAAHNKELLVFGLAIVCLLSGDVARLSLLPLHVTRDLRAAPEALGLVFAITPLFEIPLLPLAGLLADRLGSRTVLLFGGASAFAYYAGLVVASALWHVYVLQALYAVVIAAVVGVGISHAQRLGRGEPGTASGVYFSAQNGAVIVGSLLAGAIAERFGLAAAFMVPAALCVVALVLIAMGGDLRDDMRPARSLEEVVA